MRGLKPLVQDLSALVGRRILYGCVDWNFQGIAEGIARAESHPLRMRGLKPTTWSLLRGMRRRILYGCVDWNIYLLAEALCEDWSHPLRMRGLKQTQGLKVCNSQGSHPLRMRGLKPFRSDPHGRPRIVASFTDAWIETRYKVPRQNVAESRILYGCVDWNHSRLF